MKREEKKELDQAIFIAFETVSGIISSILAIYILKPKENLDIFTYYLNLFLIIAVCIIAGVNLVGYFQYRISRRLNDFWKAFALSVLGFIAALFVWLLMDQLLLRHFGGNFSRFSMLILLISGTIVGLNYPLRKKQ